MLRSGVSILGGMAMALGLFWLLALLVVPPRAEAEKPIQEMSLSVVEAPQSAPAPAETPPTPVESATPPPPAPAAPSAESSAITLPEAELPDAPAETMVLESKLPELTEAKPKPKPKPTPKPDPTPEPVAEPSPAPSATSSSREASAEPAAEPAKPTSNEPVDVGQATPISRVNPVYPSRAQRRGMEGFVEVSFIIRRDGSVKTGSIDITRAKPRRMFDKAARKAIAQWQFEPSERRRRATQRIQFKLR
jgi:protein TonB